MDPTTNYTLKKWDASDRVLRTEFNDNFDKIDAAIAAAFGRCCFTKLKEEVTAEGTGTVKLDLTDVDWSAWQIVRVDMALFNSNGGTAEIGVNGGGGNYLTMGGSSSTPFAKATILKNTAAFHPQPAQIFFFPLGNADNYVRALTFGTSFCYSYRSSAYRDIRYLDAVTTATNFSAGCQLSVWGMR